MSKAVLISIQPKWCELIASGQKTIEIRKTRPKIETPFKCYMYMSAYHWAFSLLRDYGMEDLADRLLQETGKVIGEFVCDSISEIINVGNAFKVGKTASETNRVARASCLDFGDMHDYLGHKGGYGWHISDLKIYDEPKKLTDFIRPSGGCCNEGKCTGCGFFDKGNGYNVEDDCFADFDTDMYSIVTRPPQSWCYVEED